MRLNVEPLEAFIESLLTEQPRDLCMNCAHHNACIYRVSATTNIMLCELFECEPPVAAAAVLTLNPTNGSHVASTEPGLCGTCGQRSHCKLTKPPGGVWHCEEYY